MTATFAGQKMVVRHEGAATIIEFNDQGIGRSCGDCTLCCKLLAVRELGKEAGVKCGHAKHKGCAIYERRPPSCKTWSCLWLADEDTRGLPRPDRAHYVIDMVPDFVTAADDQGHRCKIPVVQVWVDPAYPDAWRAKSFRDYLDMICARDGIAALIRYNARDALTVFPPSFTPAGVWREIEGNLEEEHHSPHILCITEGDA